MIQKKRNIRSKGFTINTPQRDDDFIIPSVNDNHPAIDFARVKVGANVLKDAALETSIYSKVNKDYGDKEAILRAINTSDYEKMREISNFFFRTSGIYANLCRYLADLYRYDWYITPYLADSIKKEKAVSEFDKVLFFLDKSEIKRFCRETALKIIRNGVYYGYVIPTADRVAIQELPIQYCRSTNITIGNKTMIEFNLKFFDDNFRRNEEMKKRVLSMFPKEFEKAYKLYENKKLPLDSRGEKSSWFALSIENTVKFNIDGEDMPPFMSVIPAIIDLGAAQELDRKKMQQQLLKLIIQKMPVDKNGDLVFDVDEAKELHNNAVRMLGKAIGIDVLTTFADTTVETLTDRTSSTTVDELEKVERGLFNESGTSELLFNADNSVALEKSIAKDEAFMFGLIIQFEEFYNDILDNLFNKNPKKMNFRLSFLTTTQNNYLVLSKTYKEQMQVGYGKMLSQIALGHSQSSLLATAKFENDVLELINIFVPPLMSSTMNPSVLKGGDGEKKSGRPTNEEQGKPISEKTAANKESQGNG